MTGVLPLIDAGIAHLAARLGDLSSAGAEPAARAAHSLAGAASTVGLRWTALRARETETALRRGEERTAAVVEVVHDDDDDGAISVRERHANTIDESGSRHEPSPSRLVRKWFRASASR